MPDIGVRQLKEQASEIIRQVRDERVRYVITHRGAPVAVLLPFDEAGQPPAGVEVWDELSQLGEEVGRRWRDDRLPTELLAELRR